MKLCELMETDFYTFFNLYEIHPVNPLPSFLVFKTGGFQEYITIEIHIDEQKNINGAILILDRDWIGNANSINPFGKDIAKSFIATFIPQPVQGEFRETLLTSLWNMKGTEDTIICIDKVVKIWEDSDIEVKDFLDVYRDIKIEARKVIDGHELIMKNVNEAKKKLLKISISLIDQ